MFKISVYLDIARLLVARSRRKIMGNVIPRTKVDVCFVLVSGGVDSTVALYLAQKIYKKVYAIELEYENRLPIEKDRVSNILSMANVESFYIEYPRVIGRTTLENKHQLHESNTFYYLTAANLAQSYIRTNKIKAVDIWAGQIRSDWLISKSFSGGNFLQYVPEASPSIYKLLNKIIRTDDPKQDVKIVTPFIYLNKDEVVEIGVQVNAPLKDTWSCSYDNKVPCSECQQCLERNRAFKKFNINEESDNI